MFAFLPTERQCRPHPVHHEIEICDQPRFSREIAFSRESADKPLCPYKSNLRPDDLGADMLAAVL